MSASVSGSSAIKKAAGGRTRSTSSAAGDDGFSHLEDDVVQDALRSGVDLRTYSQQVEAELKTVERAAVQDYIEEAEQIAGLHHEISACDSVLEKIEDMLESFQADLGKISSDIESLQEQSTAIQLQLGNKRTVRTQLSQFVDDIVISRHTIQVIVEVDPSERSFLEVLHELQHKLQFIKNQQFRDVRATHDVLHVAEQLKIKAIDKVRHFVLQRIYLLRKPLANFQVPQNQLLKYRFYYEFLLANERTIASEIRDEFVDTLSKMFYSYFKTYTGRLMKLQLSDMATAADVLAAEDTVRSVSMWSSKPTVRNRATVFSLGSRIDVLGAEALQDAIIVPHMAAEKGQKFHMEVLLRSVWFALTEHACHEYMFLTDFFMLDGASAAEFFSQIFSRTLTVVNRVCEEQLALCHDAIGLQLCIHIASRYDKLMLSRDVPVLHDFWSAHLQHLWSRFDVVMRAHIGSLRSADARRLAQTCKDGPTRPHYVGHSIVRRYSELTSSLLAIALTQPPLDERLEALSTRLQTEMDGFLHRLVSEQQQQGGKDNKTQLTALINNYDLVLTVLTERLSEETREVSFVRECLSKQTERFVEEILFPHFGVMMQFVNDCEPLIQQGHTETLRRYTDKVPNIVGSFSSSWKRSIDEINQEVMQSFTNFKNGTQILQTALTQLVQYYHRFQKVVSHSAFSQCPARNELVNIHTIMVELKKYKPVF